jgi:hypothetical protein
MQKCAFVLLCIYIVSNLANDWALRLLGQRAFLSLITGVTLPLVCFAAGTAFRGLRHPLGRCWLAFLVWAVVSAPFSSWPGGTVAILFEFLTKNAPLFFYATAAVLTISQCRKLFYVSAFGGLAVILACVFFGDARTGRLMIPGSIFFDNSNDLALQLLISAAFMAFLLFSGNKVTKATGLALFSVALLYVFKTASRANFLSLGVCFAAALLLSKHRGKLLTTGAVIAILAAAFVPSKQWTRMVYIVLDPESDQPARLGANPEINGDLESQLGRMDMFKRSLVETMMHPVFGVGAGQFGTVIWSEAKKQGERVPSLGTHNTYTQVSSELGIPALILYLLVLGGSLNLNRRLYRAASHRPEARDVAAMAFCLFLATTAYSFSTFFHHVAYSRQLPTLAGMTMALWMAGTERLRQLETKAAAAAR